jgi:hypothetical protein
MELQPLALAPLLAGRVVRVGLVVDRGAERLPRPGRVAELLGQLHERVGRLKAGVRLLDRPGQDLGEGEVLEDGDDVGESLVKAEDVAVRGLEVARPQAVDERVRHLVGDDVVREAAEDGLPREVRARLLLVGPKVAEEDREEVGVVEGVRAAEGVGQEAQGRPSLEAEPAPERGVEVLEDLRRHGVNHLLVEAGVRLDRVEPPLHQESRVVEVDRLVVAAAPAVVVDDLEPLAAGPGPERLVPEGDRDPVSRRVPEHRVHGEDL